MLRGVSINERPRTGCSSVSDAQRILEEYLEPRPHDHEGLLDRLVEVLERPSLMVAVDRLQRGRSMKPTYPAIAVNRRNGLT